MTSPNEPSFTEIVDKADLTPTTSHVALHLDVRTAARLDQIEAELALLLKKRAEVRRLKTST